MEYTLDTLKDMDEKEIDIDSLNPCALAQEFVEKYHDILIKGMSGTKLYSLRKMYHINDYPPFLKELSKYCYIWANPGGPNPGAALKVSQYGREIENRILAGNTDIIFKNKSHMLKLYSLNEILSNKDRINFNEE